MIDFELFQKEFKKWQRKFGLTGYKVYFMRQYRNWYSNLRSLLVRLSSGREEAKCVGETL